MSTRAALTLVFSCVVGTTLLAAEPPQVDYNQRYRFPVSIGFEYQGVSPFDAYPSQFGVFGLSGELRVPIPPLPVLQPLLRVGMNQHTDRDLASAGRMNHTDWYASAGLGYSFRFAKGFEVGAELLGGYAVSYFPNYSPGDGTVGYGNAVFEAGARLGLDPSYNLSIEVHPSLKYTIPLGPLPDFRGLSLGVGFSASYRFGEDPDAPSAVIRAIRFSDVTLPPLFAAMQSFYVRNAVATVTITNAERRTVTDLTISFYQPGYMDSPTVCERIAELKPNEARQVKLLASFNQEVFKTEGVTPLTGELIATYSLDGKPAEQRQSVGYDLEDKTAITWDDDRKEAAFITPADSALRNYVSYIRQVSKEEVLPPASGDGRGLSEPLQIAMEVFVALGELGLLYQADPVQPFTRLQNDRTAIDSVSLPRDTLKRGTGDCDDLTAVYAALLEAAGVQTGFITSPGHIYVAVNTKVAARDYKQVHPDRGMTIAVEGELWVPVEITMIGTAGFLEAWRKGIEEWVEHDAHPERRSFIVTAQAQELYRPVGLKEADLGLQYGKSEAIAAGFRQSLDKLVEQLIAENSAAATRTGSKEDFNSLGIAYARYQRLSQAEAAFRKAASLDASYLPARVNLANILVMQKSYAKALSSYLEIRKVLDKQPKASSSLSAKVLLNISKTYYLMERYDDAKDYFARAASISPKDTESFAYLGGGGAAVASGTSGGGAGGAASGAGGAAGSEGTRAAAAPAGNAQATRASAADAGASVLFVAEEDLQ